MTRWTGCGASIPRTLGATASSCSQRYRVSTLAVVDVDGVWRDRKTAVFVAFLRCLPAVAFDGPYLRPRSRYTGLSRFMQPIRTDFKGYEGKSVAIDAPTGKIVIADEDPRVVLEGQGP